MSILCFATPADRTGKAIMDTLKSELPDERVDFCTTAGGLALKLIDRRNDEEAAILVPEDEDELIDIYSMKRLFNRVPVVLVLPNKDRFVEAMVFRLKPRFICYRDAGFMEAIHTLKDIVKDSRNANIDKVHSY